MTGFIVTAPASGSGKTMVTCALLAALKKRGMHPCAFKCGPDYIDPMFHRAALGVESHNLDLFLAGADQVRRLFVRYSAGHGAVVAEGAMGYYDGLASTDAASAWQTADTLGLPALLVVRPGGASLTLAAQINGLRDFRRPSHIAGILLNDCRPARYAALAPLLERETGLPVLGYLPPMPEAVVHSRHLGLCTAGEIADLAGRIAALAAQAEKTIDLDRLCACCQIDAPAARYAAARPAAAAAPALPATPRARIAVARDEAFCFAYAETLDALRAAGAELCFFSPLQDEKLPSGVGGLYLPGGYPELYAARLAENAALRGQIARLARAGLPTVAECGGFLYLCERLTDSQGRTWPMAGVLPARAADQKKLVRFGYAMLTAEADSLLLRAGEQVPIHEFHHWDTDANGEAFTAKKPGTGRSWRCGYAGPSLYAAFPHLYLAARPALADRFVTAAARWQAEKEELTCKHS